MNEFKTQFKLLKNSFGAKFVFCFFFAIVAVHYINNVLKYQGYDVTNMYQSMLLRLLSNENPNSEAEFFLQMFPFLVVLPGGFSLLDDVNNSSYVYFIQRTSRRRYVISKALAVFAITFLVFEIPQLIEILLNIIAFPFDATASPTNHLFFEESYVNMVRGYPFYKLMIKVPYIYALLSTLKLSVFAGIMGVFTLAVSSLGIKIKVFLFLPCYVLLYTMAYLHLFVNLPFGTNYFHYLHLYIEKFSDYVNYGAFMAFQVIMVLISVVIYIYKERTVLGVLQNDFKSK